MDDTCGESARLRLIVDPDTIAEELRRIRLSQGVKLTHIYQRVDRSRRMLDHYEQGRIPMPIPIFDQWVRTLGYRVALVYGTNSE